MLSQVPRGTVARPHWPTREEPSPQGKRLVVSKTTAYLGEAWRRKRGTTRALEMGGWRLGRPPAAIAVDLRALPDTVPKRPEQVRNTSLDRKQHPTSPRSSPSLPPKEAGQAGNGDHRDCAQGFPKSHCRCPTQFSHILGSCNLRYWC